MVTTVAPRVTLQQGFTNYNTSRALMFENEIKWLTSKLGDNVTMIEPNLVDHC